jgi:urease accessory protein
MKRTITMLLVLAAGAVPAIALAHPGAEAAHGVVAGIAHALSGVDHVVAMLAIGGWTALVARRGRLDLVLVPVAFVALLAAGAALGVGSAAAAAVEPVIALSLLVIGLLLAVRVRLPLAAALALVGGFALFHGAAHGPGLGDAAALIGLVAGTGAMHALGIAVGLFARGRGSHLGPRLAGLGVAAFGIVVGCAPFLAGGVA